MVSFSENKLNFLFNTRRGYMEYTNMDTGIKYGLNFTNASSTLDLPEGRYKFQFFSPDYHPEERIINAPGGYQSYRIDLEKKESTFFVSVIESRKQEVYLSDKPVSTGRSLDNSKIIFYKDDVPVKSLEISSLLEPVKIEHGYYNISLISGRETIFRVQRFPINDRSGKFINFFASPAQVSVKGSLKVGDMLLGGAEVTFTDVENNTYTMRSNFSGEFEGYLPARKYKVSVNRFGYKLKDEVDLIYDFTSPKVSSYTLPLELEEVPSKIGGRVFDDQGNPVIGAKVTLRSGENIYETITDNYGRFSSGTEAGLVFIKVIKDGYFHHGIVQKIEKSSTISNLEVRIGRKLYSIRGIISDGVSPVKKQRMDLVDKQGRRFNSTLSGDNGYFEFLDIPATEEYHIRTSVEGYKTFNSQPFQLKEDRYGFNIILDPSGSRMVIQALGSDSKPLKETSININGSTRTTDDNGMLYYEPEGSPVVVSYGGIQKVLEVDDHFEVYEVTF